ncbi:MAG TPA: RDD family protein [Thermoanaerobaculia bacterium]|nr:RDD family protein [Thermoanaerobaculia bacterium]
MRRPDNEEPLLFDLPLGRPARDDDAEPVIERQQPRAPRPPQTQKAQPAPPRRSSPATGRLAPAQEAAPSPPSRLPLASAAALSAQLAPPDAPAATEPPHGPRPPRDLGPEPAPQAARAAAGAIPEGSAGAAHRGISTGSASAPVGAVERAGIGRRLAAGTADLLVHLAVAVMALAGCRYLGVFPALHDWPALGVFLLSFSFLYSVVPLAFWGHTLGMAWAGLTAQSLDGEPLSFDQTARRWLGTLVTLAVLGLPLLLALTGRSLSDRLSGSRTFAA